MAGIEKYVERFNEDEQKILGHFFTNMDSPVYGLINMSNEVQAGLITRYSRSSKSVRRMMLDEFLMDKEGNYYEGLEDYLAALDSMRKFTVGGPRASELFNKVLAQYGDDSVADLASDSVIFDGVDQIQAKLLEDSRLAGYIEKSTRYVDFTKKVILDNEGFVIGSSDAYGSYLYKIYPAILDSSVANQYVSTMDSLFDSMKQMLKEVRKILRERSPLEEQVLEITVGGKRMPVKYADIDALPGIKDAEAEKEKYRKAYNESVRAQSFDIARGLLPAATITNLGWHSTYRTFRHSMLKMLGDQYLPINDTARLAYKQLEAMGKPLIEDISGKHGDEEIEYVRSRDSALRSIAERLHGRAGTDGRSVRLLRNEDDAEAALFVAAAALYPHLDMPFNEVVEALRARGAEGVSEVIKAANSGRLGRRHKAPRAFELSHSVFEIEGNFGIYRDLQRNRFALQIRQQFGIGNGFDIPTIISGTQLESMFVDRIEAAESLYKEMAEVLPVYAPLAVTFAHRTRWLMGLDAREAQWMIELRTGRQGHPDYRRVMQNVYNGLNSANPSIANSATMQFADMGQYDLARLTAVYTRIKKLERKEG
jgi:thymidylate synthase ThyX